MDHVTIKRLLEEASGEDCTPHRRNEIACMLGEATAAMTDKGYYDIDIPESGIYALINKLYYVTLQNRPEVLPTLFPVFVLACGDRDDHLIMADIDWSFEY